MVNDEQAQMLTQTLYTDGWVKVMKPVLANRANAAIKALCKPPSERDGGCKGLSDDALRSRISECEYILFEFENEVAVYRVNRQREELARPQNGIEAGLAQPSTP